MPILLGTDAALAFEFGGPVLPGFAVHTALAQFVVQGMTPLGALQTATLNPALALNATDSLGTVEAGKLADLVLLDADPLVDIANTTKIRAVVANGRYYGRAALDTLLAQAERTAHR
jgi:imidazolonepropionase-like amidohydrolase